MPTPAPRVSTAPSGQHGFPFMSSTLNLYVRPTDGAKIVLEASHASIP